MEGSREPLRVALIGAGRFGARRAAAVVKNARAALAVVADIDAAKARTVADRFGCLATTNWQQAATQENVDAVIVSTPTHLLSGVSLLAVRAGKHVLVEKPFGRTTDEILPVVRAAGAADVRLKVGHNHRYHPAIRRAHELFERGEIGRPLFARCLYGHGGRAGYEKEWRTQIELSGGGELLDQGVHALDLFRWFLGEFDEVVAMVSTAFWPIGPAEDNAFALLRATGGAVAQLHASWTNWRNVFRFDVFGDKGYLKAKGLGGSYGPECLCWGRREKPGDVPEERWTDFSGPDDSLEREWDDFLDSIFEDREPASSGAQALQTLKLVEAVYRAARDGCAVRLGNHTEREGNTLSAAR